MSEFKGNLRAPITGVTRVSRRVIFVFLLAVGGVLFLIMYGLNSRQAQAADPSAQPAQLADVTAQDNPQFGSDAVANLAAALSKQRGALHLPAFAHPTAMVRKRVDQVQPHMITPDASQSVTAVPPASMDDAVDVAMQGRAQTAQVAVSAADQMVASSMAAAASPTQRPQDAPVLVDTPNAVPEINVVAPQGAPQDGSAHSQASDQGKRTGFLNGPFGNLKQADATASQVAEDTHYIPSQRYAPRTAYELIAGSVIPAELVTAIDSELPGVLIAQVRSDVFDSRSGHSVLIPRGTRLIGVYQNQIGYGQTRVLVAWQRLIFPDTSSIDLDSQPGADSDGSGGLSGRVDNHTGRVVGALVLSSILSAASGLQAGIGTANSSNGSIIVNSAGQQVAQAGAQIAEKEANVPPTIHIPKGYPFVVVVDRDLAFSQPYTAQSAQAASP